MKTAHKIDIELLDKKVDIISDLLANLSSEEDLRKLIKEWRRPGWTTPAEYILVSGMLDSFQRQVRGLVDMKQDLFKGVEAVGR